MAIYPISHSTSSQTFSPAPVVVWLDAAEAARETASTLDRAFFAANPKRELYAREAIGPELGHMEPLNAGDVILVFVQQVAPGMRTRLPFATPKRRAKAVLAMREAQLRREMAKPG